MLRPVLLLLAAVLVLPLGAPQQDGAAPRDLALQQELIDCINQKYTGKPTTYNNSVLRDQPAGLKLERLWWSRRAGARPLTIFTQATADRLDSLWGQCNLWRGPLSAAVYVPLVASQQQQQQQQQQPGGRKSELSAVIATLDALHAKAESLPAPCQLDLMLFTELFDGPDSAELLYPVNSLRNYARLVARTALVANVDVDMLPSASLSDELAHAAGLERVRAAAQQKQALVLPAFEPTLQGSAGVPVAERAAAAFFKSDLKALVDSSNLMQFKLLQFPRGHAPTDYPSFFALPAAAPPYAIRYTRFFEPWFLAAWPHLPWFDVHFRGYGFNKVVHIASLRYHNFSFWGHPAAWLVHRPHPDTRVRQLVVGQATDMNKHRKKLPKQALYMKVSGLWQAARRAMEAGTYVAALDEPHVRCQAALPWLQRPPQLVGTKVPKGVFS